jgi:ubiquinone/menaquinone biosynthesis C-methylase UbiE
MLTFSPSGLLAKNRINSADYSLLDPTYISRYLILAGLLESYSHHNGSTKKLKVLEVGGAGSMLAQFVDIDLTLIDTLPNSENLEHYIQGDALAMPFENNSFDVVVSCDVFEHIPAASRDLFIKESSRVTKDMLVIAAPFNIAGVRDAEISANDFYKKMTGRDHRWLLEHLLDELPDLKKAISILEKRDFEIGYFSNTAINNWQLVTRIGFFLSENSQKQPESSEILQSINRYYLDNMMQTDFSETGYRTFLVASKDHQIDIKDEKDVRSESLLTIFSMLTDAMRSLV